MSAHEKETFLRVALAIQAIDLKQFNEAQKELRMGPSEDGGKVLLKKGYITEDQYREISSMIDEVDRDSSAGIIPRPRDEMSVEAGTPYSEDFDLQSIIGQGGAGRVFLAHDRMIGREVAIKEVLPAKLDRGRDYHLSRFIREAKISGRLQHPGVVPVYELKQKEDGTYFYVMKYVQGRTLFHAIMESGEDESPEKAFRNRLMLLDRLIDVAEAMGYAHSKGIIHRDLKPSNIILGEFGETVILDWGLAKRITEDDTPLEALASVPDDDTADGLTRDGAQLGTPSYMAPEQIDPSFGGVDAATDVYTLGVLLFMILTGSKPYPGRGDEVMRLIMESDGPPSPGDLYDFIPPELSAICEKAMARKKEDRFHNASELAHELKAYRDGRLVSVYAYSTGDLLKRFLLRNKTAVIITALLIISVIGGAGFSTNFAIEAHRAKVKAQNALVEVTALSESAMVLVRTKTNSANEYFKELEKDLIKTVGEIAAAGFGNKAKLKNTLKAISEKYPEAETFLLMDMKGNVITSYPTFMNIPKDMVEWELNYLKGKWKPGEDEDISGLFDTPDGHKAFVMSFPVVKGGKRLGGISMLMRLDIAIPAFLNFDPRESPYQVWLMKNDGLIVYDEDKDQIGRDLFTDEMYQNYPELLEFGELIRQQPWGIGHYSYLGKDEKHVVYKVAAWDTLKSDGTEWKLVVTHEYTNQ